jgi:hypothetical protein
VQHTAGRAAPQHSTIVYQHISVLLDGGKEKKWHFAAKIHDGEQVDVGVLTIGMSLPDR